MLLQPIKHLVNGIEKIAEGNLDARIEDSYNNEFDKIRDAVNLMASDIKIHMDSKLQAERLAYERELARLQLVDKMNHCSLTKTYNRHYLDENLNRVISTLRRSGSTLSVLMLDVDCFKKYNDTYGHIEGDKCLQTVASAIRSSLTRVDDFAARYGGEEFTIVLPNTDQNGARIIADKILTNVRSRHIPHENSNVADRVTVSIGAVSGIVTDEMNAKSFLKRADEALYQSKQNGRNRCTFV